MAHSTYEIVETSDMIPFDVSLHYVNYVPRHWHHSIEIIFVLRGKLEVTVDHETHPLTEGDVLLINQNHVHEVIGLSSNIIATYLIPMSYLKKRIHGIETFEFDCHMSSVDAGKRSSLDKIRQLLAKIVQLKQQKGEAFELEMQARLLDVFAILMKQFKTMPTGTSVNEKHMERMLRIISFIDEHYRESMTLQRISEQEYLSVPYLSKFFREHIGENFRKYLTSIRLKNAVEDLLSHPTQPIVEVAMAHGFPNAKSFYSAFKSRYHMTPHTYREHYRRGSNDCKEGNSLANYLSFNPSNALGILHQYLRSDGSFPVEEVYSFETKRHQVDLDDAHGTPIRHTWKNLMTIGKAKEGLYADVQEQLRYVQEKISFRYLRFHGIFDDDMMVYGEDPAGNPQFNFRYVDQWFDFLLSIGLKPFVELGFMPSDLASDKSKTVFYNPSYTSPPKSLDKWCEWVDGFLRHCINRYGIKEVENWKFEFWNEPEVYVFWSGTEAEYREFYRCTYETIKGISTRLQVGASAGTIPQLTSVASRDVFFSFCRNHQCLPDFIPVHFYPHDPGEARTEQEWIDLLPLQFDPNLIKEFIPISSDPDFLKRILAEEKEGLSAQNLSHLDLYLTEWNATACHRELTNDTLQAC